MGRGLNTQFGVAVESVFGTYVAPTRFFEINSEGLGLENNFLTSNSLRATGRYPQRRGIRSSRAASGPVTMEIATTGMGLLWEQALGGTATVVQQEATPAYKQTHTLDTLAAKSLTIQKGIEESPGDYKAFSYVGSKIMQTTITCAVDQIATATFDIDARNEDDSQALAVASYAATRNVFNFMNASIEVDGSTVAMVTSCEANIINNLKTDSYYLGSSGLKAEQKDDDFPELSGAVTAEFEDKTVFYDRFEGDSSAELILEFLGATISGAYQETLRLTFSDVRFEGETPKADGPGVIATDIPWTAHYNGTDEPLTLEYISTDTAV